MICIWLLFAQMDCSIFIIVSDSINIKYACPSQQFRFYIVHRSIFTDMTDKFQTRILVQHLAILCHEILTFGSSSINENNSIWYVEHQIRHFNLRVYWQYIFIFYFAPPAISNRHSIGQKKQRGIIRWNYQTVNGSVPFLRKNISNLQSHLSKKISPNSLLQKNKLYIEIVGYQATSIFTVRTTVLSKSVIKRIYFRSDVWDFQK